MVNSAPVYTLLNLHAEFNTDSEDTCNNENLANSARLFLPLVTALCRLRIFMGQRMNRGLTLS